MWLRFTALFMMLALWVPSGVSAQEEARELSESARAVVEEGEPRPWSEAVEARLEEAREGLESSALESSGEVREVEPVSLPEGFRESASSPQTLRVPRETGTLSGVGEQTSVATSTGSLGFAIPLGPLSLAYTPGLAGGWSFSTQYIVRLTDRGAPRYDDRPRWHLGEDLFALSGGEELEAVDDATVEAVDCAGLSASCASRPSDVVGWQQYRTRIEGGFRRVFRSPDSRRWVVLMPDGSRQDYGVLPESEGYAGVSSESRASVYSESAGASGRIYRWNLTRSADRHGNVTWYVYDEDQGNRYLRDVYAMAPWGACGALGSVSARMRCGAPLSSYGSRAHVVWEPRPDVTTSYRSTWAVVTARRIRRVVTTAALGAPGTRHYVGQSILSYAGSAHVSRLDRVVVEGRPSVMSPLGVPVSDWSITEAAALASEALGGERLPPLELEYTEQPSANPIAGWGGFDGTVRRLSAPPGRHRLGEANVDLFDVNADGLPDLIATQPDRYRTSGGRAPATGVYFNGFQGTEARPWRAGELSGAVPMGLPPGMSRVLQLSNGQLRPLDWDGDGRSELELLAGRDTSVFAVVRNDSASVRPSEQGWRFVHLPQEGHDRTLDLSLLDPSRVRLVDFDGDGRIDVVRTGGMSLQVWRNLSGIPGATVPFGTWTVVADGAGGETYLTRAEPEEHCLFTDGAPLNFADGSVRLADLNGDGLLDLVSLRGPEVRYWPGRGNGYGTDPAGCGRGLVEGGYVRMERAPRDVSALDAEMRLADVNGDGTDDFVQLLGGGGTSALRIWLNEDGRSVTAPVTLRVDAPLTSLTQEDVALVDFDGSATLDVVYGHAGDWRYVDLMGGRPPRMLVSVRGALGARSTTEWSTSIVDYLRDLRDADGCTGASCERFTWDERTGSCDRYIEERTGVCAWRAGGTPVVRPVVRATSSTDRLDVVGGTATVVRTEYAYHDGAWDGAEREVRGFAVTDTRAVGDAHHPTMRTRTHAYTGRRPDAYATDFFYDNGPRESVKGQTYLTEVMDETGEYLSTTHVSVRVRCPMRGLSGRLICYPYVRQTDALLYDVVSQTPGSSFDAGSDTVTLPSLELEVEGADVESEAPHEVSVRGARWAHTRSTVDEVVGWNLVSRATAHGRVRGAWGEPLPDEAITTHTSHANLASSETGWLFVTTSSHVTGHGSTSLLGLTHLEHDEVGNVVRSETLVTQEQLYEFGGDAYGALDYGMPAPQSVVSRVAYDTLGQVVATCLGDGDPTSGQGCLRYATVTRDTDYGRFVEAESLRVRDGVWLTTTGVVHRVEGVTSVTGPDGLTSSVRYDGLGRLVATIPPPMNGCPADAPSTTLRYHVTPSPAAQPISRIHTRTHLSCTDPSAVLETVTYVDGAGAARVTLTTGEGAGAHRWVRSGLTTRTARGTTRSAYQATWYGGSETAYASLLAVPATASTWLTYDPYGRVIASYDEVGALTTTSYHALSTDTCDPLDNDPSEPLTYGTCTTVRVDGHGRAIDRIVRNRQPELSGTQYERLFSEYRADGALLRLIRAETSDEAPRVWTSVVPGRALERTFAYDSVGRPVALRDPNTDRRSPAPTASAGFVRYLYTRTGDLAAVRMPNGCGTNFVYDGIGRLIGEQQVACPGVVRPPSPVDVSPPGSVGLDALPAPVPLHAVSYYDAYDNAWADPNTIDDLPPNQMSNLLGRLVGMADEGARSLVVYDERGAAYATALQVALVPGVDSGAPATLSYGDGTPPSVLVVNGPAASVDYDETRTYVSVTGADFAGRSRWVVRPSTDDDGTLVRWAGLLHYGARGLPSGATARLVLGGGVPQNTPDGTLSFAGGATTSDTPIVQSITYDVFGAPVEVVQAGGLVSQTSYDVRGLPTHVRTTRTPTAVATALERPLGAISELFDEALVWNGARRLVQRIDQRDPTELPDGHRPRSVDIVHDALYRVVGAEYTYRNDSGDTLFDAFTDYRAGIAATSPHDPMRPELPARLAAPPPGRVVSQTWEYDWLASMVHSTDDAGDAPERSLGALVHGAHLPDLDARPAALYLTVADGSWTEVAYDQAGFMTSITTHAECTDAPGASCADPGGPLASRVSALRSGCVCQRDEMTQLRWDAVGRLADARRYDHEHGSPSWELGSWMRYLYSGVSRVAKWVHTPDVAGMAPPDRVALTILPGAFERRGVVVGPSGYEDHASLDSETQVLVAGARIVWDHSTPVASGLDRHHRMTLAVTDVLGTTGAVVDLVSGELVETSTRDAHGNLETFRTEGDVAMEPRGFTGKEDDLEVGLIYFGFRYLSPRLRQWISPDPLEIHAPGGGGELGNPYHYVSGNVFQATDPLGLEVNDVVATDETGAASEVDNGDGTTSVWDDETGTWTTRTAAPSVGCHGACQPDESSASDQLTSYSEFADWMRRGQPLSPAETQQLLELQGFDDQLNRGDVPFGATCDTSPGGAAVCHGLANRGVRNPHVGAGVQIIGATAVGFVTGGPPGALAAMAGAGAEQAVLAAGGNETGAAVLGMGVSLGVGALASSGRAGLTRAATDSAVESSPRAGASWFARRMGRVTAADVTGEIRPTGSMWYEVPNQAGGSVWVTTKAVRHHQVAGLISSIDDGRPILLLTGTHGEVSGGLSSELRFFSEDLALRLGRPNLIVVDVAQMNRSGLVSLIGNTDGAHVVAAWCFSERSTVVTDAVRLVLPF